MKIKLGKVNPKHLYTKQEMAKRLGVTPGRISQLIRSKDDRICIVEINGGFVMYDAGSKIDK